MGFSKLVITTFLVIILVTLVISVESYGDCSFNYVSYEGPQKKFNVILKDGTAVETQFKWLMNCCNKTINHISNVDFSKNFEENTVRDFSVEDALYGYTAYFDSEFVEQHLKNNEDIELVEEDAKVSIQNQQHHRQNHHKRFSTVVRKNPTPNLDRIDQEKFPLDGK